jgi:hypothetical protein
MANITIEFNDLEQKDLIAIIVWIKRIVENGQLDIFDHQRQTVNKLATIMGLDPLG